MVSRPLPNRSDYRGPRGGSDRRACRKGPALGRPLVDRLKSSAYHNMKELRPGSAGTTEVRMIFAFDPAREAVFLVAGDKSGRWQAWYRTAIPLADARFTEHLAALKAEEQS
jgi:hypothetical protein